MENAKAYPIVIAIFGGLLICSLACNLVTLNKSTEVDVWKQTAIEKIEEVGFLRNADRNQAAAIQTMLDEFKALGIGKVDTVLQKYMPK